MFDLGGLGHKVSTRDGNVEFVVLRVLIKTVGKWIKEFQQISTKKAKKWARKLEEALYKRWYANNKHMKMELDFMRHHRNAKWYHNDIPLSRMPKMERKEKKDTGKW